MGDKFSKWLDGKERKVIPRSKTTEVIPASKLDANATVFKVGTRADVEAYARSHGGRGVIVKFDNGEFGYASRPVSMKGKAHPVLRLDVHDRPTRYTRKSDGRPSVVPGILGKVGTNKAIVFGGTPVHYEGDTSHRVAKAMQAKKIAKAQAKSGVRLFTLQPGDFVRWSKKGALNIVVDPKHAYLKEVPSGIVTSLPSDSLVFPAKPRNKADREFGHWQLHYARNDGTNSRGAEKVVTEVVKDLDGVYTCADRLSYTMKSGAVIETAWAYNPKTGAWKWLIKQGRKLKLTLRGMPYYF